MLSETSAESASAELIRQFSDLNAPAPDYNFAFSEFLKREYRFGIPLTRPPCKADSEGHCPLGNACPDRHRFSRSRDICKHWLKGLCKKGDHCEFLHEYNLRRMPECTQYARTLTCPNGDECLYQHTDPTTRLPPCPHYEQGFCPLGPRCSKKHVRKTLCNFYLAGFCPGGKHCKEGVHPRWVEDLPKPTVKVERTEAELEAERARLREEAEREDERDWDRGRGGREGRNRGKGRYGPRRRY